MGEGLKTFEIFSNKKPSSGLREFRLVLNEIYPDECIDELNEVGTKYNLNGITWIREYCEKAIETIKDKSLRCEFLDEERTELYSHGNTGVVDGCPQFEDATVIGHFTKGSIEELEIGGEKILACVGEGVIDESCYPNLVECLESSFDNFEPIRGSVEITRKDENESILYKYGFKEAGRIPTEFIYSGYALLGVPPADSKSVMIELNEEENKMNEEIIKKYIDEAVAKVIDAKSMAEKCQADIDKAEAEKKEAQDAYQAKIDELVEEKDELEAEIQRLKDELASEKEACKSTQEELAACKSEVEACKKKEKINEMEAELSAFSAEELDYAKEEIEQFKSNPLESEINSITSKIYQCIGEKLKVEMNARKEKELEMNSDNKHEEEIDLFSEIIESEDIASIF